MHCPGCGTYNDDDSIYCSKCGQNLRESVNNNYNNGNSGKKPFSLGKLIAVVLVLFILVAMAGVCVNYANKRGDVADQMEVLKNLEEQLELKFQNLGRNSEDINSYNKNEFISEINSIKSDIKYFESKLDDIDTSVLTDEEKREYEVAVYDAEFGSELIDSFGRWLPDILESSKEMDSATKSYNRYGIIVAAKKIKYQSESFIDELNTLEKKIKNQKLYSDSKEMEKYCSESLIELNDMKSDMNKMVTQCDQIISQA